MNEGVIQVNGFGDPIGAHRGINKQAGRSPNFTAIAHKTYFGMLPDVRIQLTAVKNFTIRMVNDVEGAEYTVIAAGDTIKANADGTFTGTYGTYMVKAAKKGYIEDIIEPRNTRFRVIRALESLNGKRQELPAKKHDNLPL